LTIIGQKSAKFSNHFFSCHNFILCVCVFFIDFIKSENIHPMKFQHNPVMSGQFSDPRFRSDGGMDGKFVNHSSLKQQQNETGVFKARIIENMKREPFDHELDSEFAKSRYHWQSKDSTSEKMMCDSTSNFPPSSSTSAMRFSGRFAVPQDPSEYRNSNKLTTPERFITPAEYLRSRHGSYSDRPISAATSLKSSYMEMPGSRNSGSISLNQARGKKRMLSVSPISSDILDLNEIIRTSPNSLVAFVNGGDLRSGFISRTSTGRNSSAASNLSHGSYGHLSPSVVSRPMPPSRQRNHFPINETFQPPQPPTSHQHPTSSTSTSFIQHPRRIAQPPPTSVRDVSSSTGDFAVPQLHHRQQQPQQQQQQQQQMKHDEGEHSPKQQYSPEKPDESSSPEV